MNQSETWDRLVAQSTTTTPGGALIWTMRVSDQLVEAAGEDWSQPVRFRFERCKDGALEMWLRDEPTPVPPLPRS